MARPLTPLPKNTEKHMLNLLKKSSSIWEHRRIQCILFRTQGMSAEHTARLVGLHPASVWRIWSAYLQDGEKALLGEKRGKVRGNAHLTIKQEEKILRSFLRKSDCGQLVTISQVHIALCNKLKKEVDESTTYRMLKRHGWRKIVPLPEHPKGNKEEREKFKKAFSPTG
jgi:transposase